MNKKDNMSNCNSVENVFLQASDLKGLSVLADKLLTINILKDLSDRKMFKYIDMMEKQITPQLWKDVWISMFSAQYKRTFFKQKITNGNLELLKKSGVEIIPANKLLLGMAAALKYPQEMIDQLRLQAENTTDVNSSRNHADASLSSVPGDLKGNSNISSNPLNRQNSGQQPYNHRVSGTVQYQPTNSNPSWNISTSQFAQPQNTTQPRSSICLDVNNSGYFESKMASFLFFLIGWCIFAINVYYLVFGLGNNSYLQKASTILTFVLAALSIFSLNFLERFRGHGGLAIWASIIYGIFFSFGNATAWYVQHGKSNCVKTWEFCLIQLAIFGISIFIGGRLGDRQNRLHRHYR